MKEYQKPKIEFFIIDEDDIITTSGGIDYGDEENEPTIDVGDL